MARKKTNGRTQVDVIKHKDKRTNIPTKELRDFVAEDENKPKTITFPGLLYARDPSLDPQLVWKGKDEQDKEPLKVPAVPIYIQEKIHPQAIIEDIRRQGNKAEPEQPQLFADFNGIKFEDLIEFYQHNQNWANRMILGDSLLVMTSLSEKEGLKGKIQTIYMDPPYGIEFGSNWQVSVRRTDVKDGKAADATRQPEQIRAFRDTWKLGVHSYLSYLRDRLTAARELLAESGSMFLQISDANAHIVRNLMDEVFGADNFISMIRYRTRTMALQSTLLDVCYDHLIWYAKNKEHVKFRKLFRKQDVEGDSNYKFVELPDGTRRQMTRAEQQNHTLLPANARVYRQHYLKPTQYRKNQDFNFTFEGKVYPPPGGNENLTPDNVHSWATTEEGMRRLSWANRLQVSGKTLEYVLFHDDYPVTSLHSVWTDTAAASEKHYVVETSEKVIERCLLMTTDPGDLVLDPTCGSGTTAFVAEEWGRRWITLDTSRVALALARTRLMAARYPYYLLTDTQEGCMKNAELSGKVQNEQSLNADIRKGFVYKRVPHVTLKSIANNPEIKNGMSKEEIEAAISRNSDQELLYDQPYEDPKRIRVTGPFTVESLSPHRMLTTDGDVANNDGDGRTSNYTAMVISNLKTAGVQNTVKRERLKFDRLEPYAGVWVHAAGEYTESGKGKRVAVCIGPENGTVGADLVKEAAKEAVKGVGFDLLVVCGLAFDPYVSEEMKRYGKLQVLAARMNPDLTMGEELLKKTGAGNLFTVFGEPDVALTKAKNGQWVVEIKGVDVYDPTTGEVRSHSTDDIACWFLDTDYNEESFFVRHAYFCGADEPYEKLKKALRAEVDEFAWSSLYATKSRPFDPPKKGKIAVKVINHYGDEVLKVYSVNG